MAGTFAQAVDFNRFEERKKSSNIPKNCEAIKSAVVTIYAGKEIGSGSVISSGRWIITNYHVVQDRLDHFQDKTLWVQTFNGVSYSGKVVGCDRPNDLALIQLNGEQTLPTMPLADGGKLRPGQSVWAIGSPYGCPGVLTEGTLSKVKSNGDLQSHIILNPGNSGGPLLNSWGEMVGVNKAILQLPSGKNSGISLATSVQSVKSLLQHHCRATKATLDCHLAPSSPARLLDRPIFSDRPASSNHPVVIDSHIILKQNSAYPRRSLGLIVDSHHLIVRQVQPGSLAALGGFRPGDRLISVNGVQLKRLEELQTVLNRAPDSAVLVINRNRQQTILQVNF
ncbi:S1C family serine protease [Leptothermofonsia sp. ETS-13]|uniref:S1C family serine protease n=1 Tax=Leptothermofonsia sp. ETS-13 TaxID=3035696 RepID=UPI003BA354FC